ncbi:hypothetical protein B0H13DRAFT_1901903 [Mycena leptocephala]|nr:hypothetical protein B0H13DRAFT_1901903 [Mycena leptocephala]
MDIYYSKVECMLRLGDLYKGHGNLLKAVELWEATKPLFELSSQAKQVEHVDERLAIVGEDVQEQHRANLARLAEIHVPSATVEDLDDLSDIEDLEGLKLTGEKALGVGSLEHFKFQPAWMKQLTKNIQDIQNPSVHICHALPQAGVACY